MDTDLSSIFDAKVLGMALVLNPMVYTIANQLFKNDIIPEKYTVFVVMGIGAMLNALVSSQTTHMVLMSALAGLCFAMMNTNSIHTSSDKVADKVIDKLGLVDTSGTHDHANQR